MEEEKFNAAMGWRMGYMVKDNEKKLTITLDEEKLKELQKKYECNREVLDLALDFALHGLEEHIINNLHDDVECASYDLECMQKEL